MSLWDSLFRKTPTAADIKVQLKEVDREQRKKRRDLELQEHKKNEKVREAVAAKKAGKQELLRDVFREMRQMELDTSYVNKDLRRLSLSKTALTSFARKLEMLEKKKDQKSLQNLIIRFRESDLQKKIDAAEVDDQTFSDLLEEVLGEEELAMAGEKVREDAGFSDFDQAIGEMVKAEEAGAEDDEFARFKEEIDKAIKAESLRDI